MLRLITSLVKKGRRRLGTIKVFYLAISGKLNGSMRTAKKVIKVGAFLKLSTLHRPLEYINTCAHTR